MKNKNGFIATSLMYSFFMVFALLALTILATYSHYRYLNSDLNASIQEELNQKILSKYARLYNLVNNGSFESDDSWTMNNSEINQTIVTEICNINDVKNKLGNTNSFFTQIGSNYYFVGRNPYNYVRYNNTRYRIIGVINNRLRIVRDNQTVYNSSYNWDSANTYSSVVNLNTSYVINSGKGTYYEPYTLVNNTNNTCYAIYSSDSSFTGEKSMLMHASRPNVNTSFSQNVDVSSLVKDNKYHKIYFRFRSFKKNSILSTNSDVCLTIASNKRCYSSYFNNYLQRTYSVNPSYNGKVFFADGAPEILDYNPYNWTLHSEIIDVYFNNVNLNNNWLLNYYINDINSQGGQLFVDDVMILDVTDVYGDKLNSSALSEQQKDDTMKNYLDTYLQYFDNNYAIERYNP